MDFNIILILISLIIQINYAILNNDEENIIATNTGGNDHDNDNKSKILDPSEITISTTTTFNSQIELTEMLVEDEVITTTTTTATQSIETSQIYSTDVQMDLTTTDETSPTPTPTTTTTTVITETKNMQSFEEWKEMKIKAERRVAQEQQQAAAAAEDQLNIKNQPNNNKEQIIMKKNFASTDCGAKILSSNPESSNPSHVLTESRDDYMLNSCSNKIWFIIELCEPIKLNEIEIANFELFSNTPKQFSIYASERYPTKNWTKNFIGTYDAAPVRSIQLFNIKKSNNFHQSSGSGSRQDNNNSEVLSNGIHDIYIKYIKFEMLSHYGSEHYCPLSLVRIYGTSMDDDVVQNIDYNDINQIIKQNVTIELPVKQQTIKQLETTTTTTGVIKQNDEKISFFNKLMDNIVRFYVNRNHEINENNQVLETIVKSILCSFSRVNMNCCQCHDESSSSNYCSYYFLVLTKYKIKLFIDRYDETIINTNNNQSQDNNYTKILLNEDSYLVSNKLFFSFNNSLIKNIKEKIIKTTTTSSIAEMPPKVIENNKNEELNISTTIQPSIATNITEDTMILNEEHQTTTITTTTAKNIQIGNSNSGKDVIFMRLNNRLQALEINMSLSSQYLEQLSQHYRKQIDEMQKLFNKTTNALIDANKISDDRDAKQSERIKLIEKRLDSLQNNVNLYYYYINSFNNVSSSSTTVNNKLTTEESKDSDECSSSSNMKNEKSLNFYFNKLNLESNYLTFVNFKYELLVITLFFILLLNSCVVCIIVLIFRQRYLLLKINLYENNKIYLKKIIDDQFSKYINELRIKESKETIESLSYLSPTTTTNQQNIKPMVSSHQCGDFIQQQQNHTNKAAATVAVFTVATAVAFAASNAYNEQQQSSNSNTQSLQSSLTTKVT